MASTRSPQAYIDQLRAIESACVGCEAGADPSTLDPCITQLVQLAEALLEEREQLLATGERLAEGVFRRVASDYRAQIRAQAAAYSKAYVEIDSALGAWRAWTHGHVIGAPAPPWRPSVFS